MFLTQQLWHGHNRLQDFMSQRPSKAMENTGSCKSAYPILSPGNRQILYTLVPTELWKISNSYPCTEPTRLCECQLVQQCAHAIRSLLRQELIEQDREHQGYPKWTHYPSSSPRVTDFPKPPFYLCLDPTLCRFRDWCNYGVSIFRVVDFVVICTLIV